MASLLRVENLSKSYHKKIRVLADISLTVEQGEFMALLGPSGCGKTSLLATLAGFITPDTGSVFIDGQDVTQMPAYKRPLNTVFQSYALFPHMSVLANVEYGPLRAGAGKAQARSRALESLQMVGLEDMAGRYPAEMSGGQRQRVALARAIVNRPKLLLLDEPLSALDLKLRKHMQRELKSLQEQLGISFIFVTHDQEEALAMADRIVIMNQGRIEQEGRGDDIYQYPANRFVADFIGDANLLPCDRVGGQLVLSCTGQPIEPLKAVPTGARLLAMYRPESLRLLPTQESANNNKALVREIVNIGSHTTYYLDLNDTMLEARLMGTNPMGLRKGQAVYVQFPPSAHLIEA